MFHGLAGIAVSAQSVQVCDCFDGVYSTAVFCPATVSSSNLKHEKQTEGNYAAVQAALALLQACT